MAGIYLHIPFCKQACHYCNFHFSTSMKLKNDFLDALLKEIVLRKDYAGGEPVNTIYFGGGTPSLLAQNELRQIMRALREHYDIAASAEITFEANPDDITAPALSGWKEEGINRLSIGVQSFFEEDLVWMNRAHSANQASDCIRLAQAAGISNMSIDLIYGTPGLTDDKWMTNLNTAVGLGIPHLSCYALTVEPGTALENMTRRKKVAEVNPGDQARQFLLMTDFLQNKGYEHYEISNLALPGKRSRHNSSYWNGAKYVGLGPSAHSFNGESRQWNIANNALYIQSLKKGELPFEIEHLSTEQKLNEYIMTSLRTVEGLDIQHADELSGKKYTGELLNSAEQFIKTGRLVNNNGRLMLTREGKLFADGIAAELFAG